MKQTPKQRWYSQRSKYRLLRRLGKGRWEIPEAWLDKYSDLGPANYGWDRLHEWPMLKIFTSLKTWADSKTIREVISRYMKANYVALSEPDFPKEYD